MDELEAELEAELDGEDDDVLEQLTSTGPVAAGPEATGLESLPTVPDKELPAAAKEHSELDELEQWAALAS